jgi:hypothetical protein
MRATRRRQRTPDPLATRAAVSAVCQKLRMGLPGVIPNSEKQLFRFLYAVRYVERRPATDTLRGRPPRWPREKLTEAATILRGILERETVGRVSVNSFVGQYLPLLQFPSDVSEALESGSVNLQEAAQLARVTPARLSCSPSNARKLREDILKSHIATQGSQTRLRHRIKEILGESAVQEVSSQNMATVIAQADELLEIDPQDSRHLFWEEMKRIFFAMREVRLEDLDAEMMEEFMTSIDHVSNVLFKIEKRRRERERAL